MIRFEHVSKQYAAGSFSLTNISFEIEQGEFVFLIGGSGAGKTTILKLILRQILPSEGSVYVENELVSDPHFHRVEELRRKMGIIFQDFKIVEDKNVLENIMLSLAILNFKSPREEAMSVLKKVGLSGREGFFPLQLSAGELQRLAIARAIAGGRKIILADEPTGNLDPVTTWEIMKLFRQIQSKDTTIIIATHNTDIVNTLKKRVIVVQKGTIIKDSHKGSYTLDHT
jgi:cell division transport system ATP-binding protein